MLVLEQVSQFSATNQRKWPISEISSLEGPLILIIRHLEKISVYERKIAEAVIDGNLANEIGFVLELFQIELVRTTKHFPIYMTKIIARNVLTVFGEFDRIATRRTTMRAGKKTLDDMTSTEQVQLAYELIPGRAEPGLESAAFWPLRTRPPSCSARAKRPLRPPAA